MANSVTARFNDDCKVHVAMSDDTTVTKAVIIDAEGNETDIGGGGESDFSTAEMTINLDDGSVVNFNVANYQIQGDQGMALGESSIFASTPNIINVILCKGSSMLTITRLLPEGSNVSISGDIEDVGNNSYIITGDCAITLTNPA